MNSKTIGFIGLGLIGGSIAKALRRVHPDIRLVAYNRTKQSLVSALADGTLNQVTDNIDSTFSECDIIFLCMPVSKNIASLPKLKTLIKDTCIITDVGSVKTSIHTAVTELDMEQNFIGGHPMAGSEKFGYANASDRLLENAYYIITPTERAKPAQIGLLQQLVADIVSIPVILNYTEHDYITAAISHLPHIIAFTLVNLVRRSDNPEGVMRMLAAGGFKDITRIASSSPEMWEQICIENQSPITDTLQTYMHDLGVVAEAVTKKDGMYLNHFFDEAREYRNSMQSKFHGGIQPANEIYVDLIDEAGAIATIATILASNSVSIKNIGIMHNREFQDGILRIEFYDVLATDHAAEVLKKHHYPVNLRS